MQPQPDGVSCGATCLEAVYRFYRRPVGLEALRDRVESMEDSGTLAVLLGLDALQRNWSARLFTFNVQIFDPTWADLARPELQTRLLARRKAKRNAKMRFALQAYADFLEAGGELTFSDLDARLLGELVDQGPVIAGLSATFLYRSIRERSHDLVDDDIRGDPVGHFVVVHGRDETCENFRLADPEQPNRLGPGGSYWVGANRLIASILLGAVTYDANLLVLNPPSGRS